MLGNIDFSPWHISSLVASSAIQSWRVCNTKLRRKFKKREGGLVQKKPEPTQGRRKYAALGNINIVQEKLGANIFLEFGIWGTSQIDNGLLITEGWQ